ncbi:hypothetical protein HP456_14915 [Bacillus haikouensis]|jgi:hypothetical protein|uniref:hypothetical protein n=1 Tax=Bacillus haikouensis TaxID=1510468 RepID=UPI00155820ED|nr:hypothetical protein [Bacillus haikouensis]NQD67204.1 hypothetical protein [Bacillus haikouensis]
MENKFKPVIDRAVMKLYERYPELGERFGEVGKQKCYEDNVHHFNYLQTTAAAGDEKVFIDYALWLNNVLISRGMKSDHLIDNFVCLLEALAESGSEEAEIFQHYLNAGIRAIRENDLAQQLEKE